MFSPSTGAACHAHHILEYLSVEGTPEDGHGSDRAFDLSSGSIPLEVRLTVDSKSCGSRPCEQQSVEIVEQDCSLNFGLKHFVVLRSEKRKGRFYSGMKASSGWVQLFWTEKENR